MQFHRRQLHVQNFASGGKRKQYGSTISKGMPRGTILKDLKNDMLYYLGGTSKPGYVAIHSLTSGKRVQQHKLVKKIMKDLKVLFVAGGRRVSLAERFIEHKFKIYSYETETKCPISLVGTVVEGKKWDDPDIENHLLGVIKELDVDLVIPLADKATSLLSRLIVKNPELKNKIPTSSEKTNNICLNKKLFEQELWDKSYYPRVMEGYPVICKPIFGNSSKGIEKINWEDYISNQPYWEENFVCQRLIPGNLEISVDCYFSRSGKLIGAVPRQRIEVSGGEISRGITLKRNVYGLEDLVRELGEKIQLRGPCCIQFMIEDEKPFIEEVNSRAGGGLTVSIQAGFNIIKLIKEEYIENKEINSKIFKYKEGLGLVRYMKDYYYE